MLPKPTEKTGRAIVSAASTARLVFEVGLSVAGKGGSPVAPIFGVFGRFVFFFWLFLSFFCHSFCIEVLFGHLVDFLIIFWAYISEFR